MKAYYYAYVTLHKTYTNPVLQYCCIETKNFNILYIKFASFTKKTFKVFNFFLSSTIKAAVHVKPLNSHFLKSCFLIL